MTKLHRGWVPASIAVGVLGIWLLGATLPVKLIDTWEHRGQFGDLFGATNALFSGLAFAGLIYAVLLQREELSLQRKELELTRDQLKRTADAQEKSERALAEQVEMQLLAVRLQALSALLSHRASTAGQNVYADAALKMAGRDAETYATQVEGLLRHLSTFK